MAKRLPTPNGVLRRLLLAGGLLLLAVLLGGVGFFHIGGGRWGWFDCFYMTVITLSTVGFGETLPGMHEEVLARIWTIGVIVVGSGTLVYFVSNLTALIVEGDLQGALRRRSMQKSIDGLSGHYVVCGVGTTGQHVVKELAAVNEPFVAIDRDEDRLKWMETQLGRPLLYVAGDAGDDATLEQAGVARAKGVIAALSDDKDNLFVTITARALNARARIVAKAVAPSAEPKLRRAGADAVVYPNSIGGMRLASEMLRPSVVAFLDRMLRDGTPALRVEEIAIPAGSPLAETPLSRVRLHANSQALVIAVRTLDGQFAYNPSGETTLSPGMTLIVLATSDEVKSLRKTVSGQAA